MEMLEEGKQAPSFNLKDKDGQSYSLEALLEGQKFLVVYFYPRDNTPGCTLEAKEFSGLLDQFSECNTNIVGISGGDSKSKQKFCEKHALDICLLSDPDYSVAKAYGAYGEKSFMGKKFSGIIRSTFILDATGAIAKCYPSVRARTHAAKVLDWVRSVN